MRIEFEQVKLQGHKSGKCACGKKRTRSKTFSQTLNPYNKNENGQIKSREEIWDELITERADWSKKQIFCEACRPLRYWEITNEQRKEYNEKGEVLTKTKMGQDYLLVNPIKTRRRKNEKD